MLRSQVAWRYAFCLSAVLALLLIPPGRQADAHAYSAGYTTLQFTKSGVEMTYTLDELSVIELTGADADKNGMLEPEEFAAAEDSVKALLKQQIRLAIDRKDQEATGAVSLTLERQGNAAKAVLKANYPPVSASQTVSLTDQLYQNDTVTNYVNLVTIQYGSHKSTSALSGKYREWAMQMSADAYAGLPSDAQSDGQPHDGASAAGSGWYSFFVLGMNHILTGYDHLLFLFSLLIARQKFKQYAGMITAFTIAHSMTLTLTVLGIIHVSPRIVEPMIALSICFVAVDNVVRKQVSHRWVLTFLFGLIHGMGFADILQEMNIPRSELAADLISFNLGIEAVQVTLVAAILPLLMLIHRWRFSRRAIVAGSSLAFLLGGIWLVERVAF
ncbi:HupE/UreJ family protein [Cohnella nanjingensis]|uniref:HupE/UreJ family protein n=1 Tax=Cohnella nanjingensis TaxID=1387779 RepID=A0A7X0RQR4_9BACL|nr:HupE/UreJ family protein [Cohnella nanjingensis]MBB6670680.1 HupE/UreJ family protein [Cohnella nanjingensis]